MSRVEASLEFFVAIFTLSAQPDSIALVFPCVSSGGWFAGSFFSMFPCTVSFLSFLCHSASLSPYFSSPSVVDSCYTFLVFSSLVVQVGDKGCCLLSWSSLSLKYALCPWVRDVLWFCSQALWQPISAFYILQIWGWSSFYAFPHT